MFLLITTTGITAQEGSEHQEHPQEELHETHQGDEHTTHHDFKHSIAVMLGHTHISEGRDAIGDSKWLAVPSFAIDYNYLINERWSVGLHNDIIIESFFVERHLSGGEEQEILEREYPIASIAMIGYKFSDHFTFNAGAGGEFASGENFVMLRFGFEGGWHMPDPSWELIGGINYDIKIDGYDIWNLTFGVAKRF